MTLAADPTSPPQATRRASQSFGVRLPTSIIARVEAEVDRSMLRSKGTPFNFNSYIVAAVVEKLAHAGRNRSKRRPSRIKELRAENDRLRKIIEQLTNESAAKATGEKL